jgi:exodeoxyribonuclease X
MAILLDTETNSLGYKEPIEVAWTRISSDLKSHSKIEQERFAPNNPIDIGAAAVHLIMPCEVDGLPSSDEAASRIPDDAEHWIAHNIDFDWEVLGSPNIKRICTLACARKLWPELPSHKLGALFLHLYGMTIDNANRLREAHAADVDVEILFDVMLKISDAASVSSVNELYEYSEDARIPTHMPFGKHRGWPVSELPKDYVGWLLRQPDLDTYLVKSLQNNFG